jgi:hypothetical protein
MGLKFGFEACPAAITDRSLSVKWMEAGVGIEPAYTALQAAA